MDRSEPAIEQVELRGIEAARPTAEVLEALQGAELIVIGPSNPVISIGPVLAVRGIREAIASSTAPVIAVSPFVAGAVVKGPTAAFMAALGRPATAAGAASLYEGLLSGMIADEGDPDPPPDEPQTLVIPTLMNTIEHRVRVAQATIDFAAALRGA